MRMSLRTKSRLSAFGCPARTHLFARTKLKVRDSLDSSLLTWRTILWVSFGTIDPVSAFGCPATKTMFERTTVPLWGSLYSFLLPIGGRCFLCPSGRRGMCPPEGRSPRSFMFCRTIARVESGWTYPFMATLRQSDCSQERMNNCGAATSLGCDGIPVRKDELAYALPAAARESKCPLGR